MILNSADIPNLYASDEKGEIMDKIQGVAKAEQVSDGRWARSGGIFLCGKMRNEKQRVTRKDLAKRKTFYELAKRKNTFYLDMVSINVIKNFTTSEPM